VASSYRAWIEELEQAEEQARQEEEQKRQQGIASAANELRELQKAQSQVSNRLDISGGVTPTEASESWPSTRAQENSTMAGTNSLEAKLRALSPQASQRIRAASEAMEQVIASGNDGQFEAAESYADIAGRLLSRPNRVASAIADGARPAIITTAGRLLGAMWRFAVNMR
jgi:hypothetical protein